MVQRLLIRFSILVFQWIFNNAYYLQTCCICIVRGEELIICLIYLTTLVVWWTSNRLRCERCGFDSDGTNVMTSLKIKLNPVLNTWP